MIYIIGAFLSYLIYDSINNFPDEDEDDFR